MLKLLLTAHCKEVSLLKKLHYIKETRHAGYMFYIIDRDSPEAPNF